MAYLFLHHDGQITSPHTIPHAVAAVEHEQPPRLSGLEWSVVALARQDRLSSLRPPSRMASALRSVFRQHNPMLADERLEALRRIAVLGWHHGYAIPPAELETFQAAGFSIAQYDLLMTSIGVAQSAAKDRS